MWPFGRDNYVYTWLDFVTTCILLDLSQLLLKTIWKRFGNDLKMIFETYEGTGVDTQPLSVNVSTMWVYVRARPSVHSLFGIPRCTRGRGDILISCGRRTTTGNVMDYCCSCLYALVSVLLARRFWLSAPLVRDPSAVESTWPPQCVGNQWYCLWGIVRDDQCCLYIYMSRRRRCRSMAWCNL